MLHKILLLVFFASLVLTGIFMKIMGHLAKGGRK